MQVSLQANYFNYILLSLLLIATSTSTNFLTWSLIFRYSPEKKDILFPIPSIEREWSHQKITNNILRLQIRYIDIHGIQKLHSISLVFISISFAIFSMVTPMEVTPDTIYNYFEGIILAGLLLPLISLDIATLWLPSIICKSSIIIGLVLSFIPSSFNQENPYRIVSEHILAAIIGFLCFRFISLTSFLITRRVCLGKGDANLAAIAGAWLGLKEMFIAISLAFTLGALLISIGKIVKIVSSRQVLPFAPYMGTAIFVTSIAEKNWLHTNWTALLGL